MADATTDFRTVIETTPTCRFYRPDPVPGDVLARVFDATRWAPTGGNRQGVRFVAVRDAAVIGLVSAFSTPVLHRALPVGRVSVLVVARPHAGQGIGSALLRHAEQFLADLGCGRLEVTSASHREAAHRFYRERGYAQQGVKFTREVSGREP